jgi:hypothetical protein
MTENIDHENRAALMSAISAARQAQDPDDGMLGVSAMRKIDEDGDIEWRVDLCAATDYVIQLDDRMDTSQMSNDAIASFITDVWDEEWDDDERGGYEIEVVQVDITGRPDIEAFLESLD